MDMQAQARRALRTLVAATLAACATSAFAQAYPGGDGNGRLRLRTPQPAEDREHTRDPVLVAHPLAVLATALQREAPTMNLSSAASEAMGSFIRELKDFAALDDRHVRDRVGIARSPVHANVELQHDLSEVQQSAHEFEAAAADLLGRWKALRGLLDNAQRDRVEGIYSAALIDARQPPRRKPGDDGR